MKKIMFLALIILTACNREAKKSAFEGEMKYEHEVAEVGTIPDQSIFMLPDTFETQNNEKIVLKDLAGKPSIVAMMFTHCDYACPRLVADIKQIQADAHLAPGKVNYVLVSFDTERDTPEALKRYAENLHLDDDYVLLHGKDDAVRTLSVLLNVQYQKDVNGNYSHSNVISVLDSGGELIHQKEGLEANHEGTIRALKGQG